MTHSYRMHFFHLIWSIKERRPLITAELQDRLYAYMGAIIREHSGKLLEIGGMPDHVHLLVEMSNLDKYSHFLRDLKASSSKWVHTNFIKHRDFVWQEGFGSFTVSYSAVEQVQKYIKNQKKHHEKMTFEEEYIKLLELNNIKYDTRFVLG
jgi:putative transposase